MAQYEPRPSAYRCVVCTQQKSQQNYDDLLRCSGCKLSAYCGQDHQRKDWPKHKKFCKIISSLMRTSQVEHFLEIMGPIRHLAPEDLHRQKVACCSQLGFEITPYEKELIFHPNICCVCNEFKRENLRLCNQCFLASFCHNSHTEVDLKHHMSICSLLNIHYDLYLEKLPTKLRPISSAMDKENLPSDLVQLIGKSTGINIRDSPQNNSEYELLTSVSNFSCIATVLAAIFQLKINQSIDEKTTLIIHVVGVEQEYKMFSIHELWIIPFWLRNIQQFHILFIGPELDNLDEIDNTNTTDQVKTIFIPLTYEAFKKHHPLASECPHLIVCFNCGFSNDQNDGKGILSEKDRWKPAMECFIDYKRMPIVFTSYTFDESKRDALTLCKNIRNHSVEFIVENMPNSYKDMRPLRDDLCGNQSEIFYLNNYWNIAIITTV